MLQPVQRTLIITLGPIAQQAGQSLQGKLSQRQGPEATIAVVHLAENGVGTVQTALSDIQAGLTAISAPSLMTRLAERGYTLDDVPEIALFLLVDSSLSGAEQLANWTKEILTIIQNHLGLTAAALLIWLMDDPAGEAAAACLLTSEAHADLFARGIVALSPLNEVGLRLSDDTALAAACAEMLWLFVATPLRASLEWITEHEGQSFFSSVGISHWHWDREAMGDILHQRWLTDVFHQWSKPSTQQLAATNLEHWITDVGLSEQHIQTHIQAACAVGEPAYDETIWQAPWPWDFRYLFSLLLSMDVQDQAQQTERQTRADLRLEELLELATQTIKQQIHWLLDEKPIGGIAYANQWLTTLKQTFARLATSSQPENEPETQLDVMLYTVRHELETRQQQLLDAWPAEGVFAWVKRLGQPWQWPRLLWHYWQLRSLGQQLTLIYRHQAQRRRHHAIQLTTRHAYMEFDQIIRHCLSQVEEIGDMVGYLQKGVGDGHEQAQNCEHLLALVPLLYPLLVKEPKVEAKMAAEAIGGLGQQFLRLDDEPLMQALMACGRERLASLSGYSAAQLLTLLHPTPEAFAHWWQSFWQQATPLWRYDPARLPERIRAQGTTLTCLCGQGVHHFFKPESINSNIRCVETTEREHLFLLCLRGGLTASTMIFQRGNNNETLL